MAEPYPGFIRYRVVSRHDAGDAELTSDLPHLHQSSWRIVAMQPGNPANSTVGEFTIPLHPPGSEGYDAARAIYDQIKVGMRVEGYVSPTGTVIGGAPRFAGIIRERPSGLGPSGGHFELRGASDLDMANRSKPFPGEVFYYNYTSGASTNNTYRQARHFFGQNEIGLGSDNFNPFTAGNYNSTNLPAATAGTWTATTDDGLNVVTCSTGSGAILISKTGIAAGDSLHMHYVEVTGRLSPSADTGNAGIAGVGITANNANLTNGVIGYIRAKKNAGTGRWDCDCTIGVYNAGTPTTTAVSSALTNVDDQEGFIPYTIGLLVWNGVSNQVVQLIVNGKVIQTAPGIASTFDPGTAPAYPCLVFAVPATGSAACYSTNLVQMVRFADDLAANNNIAMFKPGSIGSPAHSLPIYTDPGPTFLDAWTNAATREGWYWRYTPQAYVVGTRTLGTVDFTADPGTDRTKSCIFSRLDGTLIGLELTANTDAFATSTSASGTPGTDGGGIGVFRDVASMKTNGISEDEVLAGATSSFQSVRMTSRQVIGNKTAIGTLTSKSVTIFRDPATAEVWRELDQVTIHDPIQGINYLTARILGYDFTEGSATQNLTLDKFSVDDPTLVVSRLQQDVFQVAKKFSAR